MIFKNESVKNKESPQESSKGNNNNSNTVDIDVKDMNKFGRYHSIPHSISPRLPVEEMKKS